MVEDLDLQGLVRGDHVGDFDPLADGQILEVQILATIEIRLPLGLQGSGRCQLEKMKASGLLVVDHHDAAGNYLGDCAFEVSVFRCRLD